MPYDIDGARKAGVPDSEIANTLAGIVGNRFDLNGARAAQVSDQDIINALIADPAIGGLHQATPAPAAPAPAAPAPTKVAPVNPYESDALIPDAASGASDMLGGAWRNLIKPFWSRLKEEPGAFVHGKDVTTLKPLDPKYLAERAAEMRKHEGELSPQDKATQQNLDRVTRALEAIPDTGTSEFATIAAGAPPPVLGGESYNKWLMAQRENIRREKLGPLLKERGREVTSDNLDALEKELQVRRRAAESERYRTIAEEFSNHPESALKMFGEGAAMAVPSLIASTAARFTGPAAPVVNTLGQFAINAPIMASDEAISLTMQELNKRNIEPTEANVKKFYAENPEVIKSITLKAAAKSATFNLIFAGGANVAHGIATAPERAAVSSAAKEAAEKGLSPLKSRQLVQENLAAIPNAERLKASGKAYGTTLGTVAVAEAGSEATAEGKVDPLRVGQAVLGQMVMAPLDIHGHVSAIRKAAAQGADPAKVVENFGYDIQYLREELPKAKTDEARQNIYDAILGMDTDLYHNGGDKDLYRPGFIKSLDETRLFYEDQLNKENTKDKPDESRVKKLERKIEFATQQRAMLETDPATLLTYEELVDFGNRFRQIENIQDPNEAKRQEAALTEEINKIRERRGFELKPSEGEVGAAGEVGTTVRGASVAGTEQSVQPGEAAKPGTEGVNAEGLGNTEPSATRPAAGEEGVNAPLDEADQHAAWLEYEATQGPVIRSRAGEGEPQGAVPHEEVQAAVADAIKGWKGGPKTEVVRSVSELPEKFRGVDPKTRAFYDPETKTTYVVSENARSAADARASVFHESLGHYGLAEKFQGELDNVLKGIYDTNHRAKAETDAWLKVNPEGYAHLGESERMVRAVEEVLARRSEAGQIKDPALRGAYNKLIAFVRNQLRKVGLVGKYSDADIRAILRQAHERVVEGKGKAEYKAQDKTIRHQFGGRSAADPKVLRTAEELEANGVKPDEIRRRTGMFRSPFDNAWRFEIDDSKAGLVVPAKSLDVGTDYKLGEIVNHPKLFAAYPELENMKVRREPVPEGGGIYKSEIDTAVMDTEISNKEFFSMLSHEIQHRIQEIEGHALGGSPKELAYTLPMDARKDYGSEIAKAIEPFTTDKQLLSELRAGDKIVIGEVLASKNRRIREAAEEVAMDHYRRLAGEVEAREVQKRLGLSEGARLNKKPFVEAFAELDEAGKEAVLQFADPDTGQVSPGMTAAAINPVPGTPKAANERLDDLRDTATELPRFNNSIKERALNALSNIPHNAADLFLNLLSTEKVAEIYDGSVSAPRKVHGLIGEWHSELHGLYSTLGKKVDDWRSTLQTLSKASKLDINKFNDIALKSTRYQIDLLSPENEKLYQEVETGKINKKVMGQDEIEAYTLMKRFKDLPQEAQDVYKGLREHYDGMRERYFDLVEKYAGQDAARKLRTEFEEKGLKVFLPLTRHGDYWTSIMDSNKDRHTLAFESNRERKEFMEWAKSEGYADITPFMRQDVDIKAQLPPLGMLSDLVETLKAKQVPNDILEAIYETFLDYSTSSSIGQMFRSRTGELGFEQDVIGSFASVAPRVERHLQKIVFADKFNTVMEDFHVQTGSKNRKPDEMQRLHGYLNKQINSVLNPQHNSLADAATSGVYYGTIALNASTGLVNTLSIPLVSMPLLEGEFGPSRTAAAYKKALETIMAGGFDPEHKFAPDWTFGVNAKGELRVLYDNLIRSGVVTQSHGIDLREVQQVGSDNYTGMWNGSKRVLGYMMQNTERFNREISAVAAFTVKRNSGASLKDSIQFALEHTEQAHGAGANESTSHLLKKPALKALASLRRFMMTTLWQQGRLIQAATVGTPNKTRALAAKQLVAMYAHSGALLGAKGIPLYGLGIIVANMFNSMFGDDNRPFDANAEVRNATGVFNGGLMDYMLDTDISSRAALSGLVWRDDPQEVRKVGGFRYAVDQIGGVVPALAGNFIDGAGMIAEGHFVRGFEKMAPASVRNATKALRYELEGVKTLDGKPIMDKDGNPIELNQYNILMQAIGFVPKEIAEAGERKRSLKEDMAYIEDRKRSIERDFMRGLEQKDEKTKDKALEDWRDLARKNPGLVGSQTLSGYIKANIVSEKLAIDGVRVPKKLHETAKGYPR